MAKKVQEKLIKDDHKKGNPKATYAEQKAAKQATVSEAEFDGPKKIEALEKKIGFVEDDKAEEVAGISEEHMTDLAEMTRDNIVPEERKSLKETAAGLRKEISPAKPRRKVKKVVVEKAKPKPSFDADQHIATMRAELSQRIGAIM